MADGRKSSHCWIGRSGDRGRGAPVRIVNATAGLLVGLAGIPLAARPAVAQSSCTQLSIPTIALGTYTGTASTTGTVSGSVTCPNGSAYSLGINQGTGSGASTTNRRLTSGAATLTYQLFQNTARTTNWGANLSSSDRNGSGSGSTQSIGVYPSIAAGQTSPPGSYTDTLIVSLTENGTTTYMFGVTATIVASCTISASNLGFGTYIGTSLTATSTLTATCTNTTPYNVGLGTGTGNPFGTHSTVTTRNMSGRDSKGLNYALFRDAARTLNWGNTVGTDTVAGTGTGTAQTLTVYGQVTAGQRISPATYTDTVIVTLTY